MQLSNRVHQVSESITLKLNARAVLLAEKGHQIYNLTAGQLPLKPPATFIEKLSGQLNFLKSYQYGPVLGLPELREKFINYFQESRNVSFKDINLDVDCAISNGAKHSLYNSLGALLNEGDEVLLLAPHWVSYPQMIKFWNGNYNVVRAQSFDAFMPNVHEIEQALTTKTKILILNSPNNPTGVHYTEDWMKQFAQLLKNFPDLIVISDEIYYELSYFDPKPTYFYQFEPELLRRTIIIDGISKFLASTGLRMGYCIAPKNVIEAIGKIQGQTTSGPSSLVQRAMMEFPLENIDEFLGPVKAHLRHNADALREHFRLKDLGTSWYQSVSAFYFMIDFARTPFFEKYKSDASGYPDMANEICEALLEKTGVAVIPGGDFGNPNSARMALVLDQAPFDEAMTRLTDFLADE